MRRELAERFASETIRLYCDRDPLRIELHKADLVPVKRAFEKLGCIVETEAEQPALTISCAKAPLRQRRLKTRTVRP